MAKSGHSIANAPGFFLKYNNTTETKSELEAYVDTKMAIIDDFLVGKNKLKSKEKKEFRNAMLNIKTKWGIDRYFREFIDSRY